MDIQYEGCVVHVAENSVDAEMETSLLLHPGDLYMARRNTGWHLLTCRTVQVSQHFVVPMEVAYCFDTWECYRVLTIR